MAPMHEGTAGLVLAAGAGTRFGGGKLLARVAGKPVLQHVLDALAGAGITDIVVVLGSDAPDIERTMVWRSERRIVNPDPARGLASSLLLGMDAIGPETAAVLIALGDQPAVSADHIRALTAAPNRPDRPIVVPSYERERGRNPVLIRRAAFGLVSETNGDRGLGPVIAAHPEWVSEIPLCGDNPDVDTPSDLGRAAETMWAARVRADRDQVDRFREVADSDDFYAPVRSMFRADPTRTDDPALTALLRHARSGDRWLDVGAGAGRYALPVALALDPSGGSVIALDASPSMLEALREIAEDHAIENVRTIEARWPPAYGSAAAAIEVDVTLIAHVGYDVEQIGPFIDALESAARRLCVAMLMEDVPASAADPFWPLVHGEARSKLPALADFVRLLEARGRDPRVEMLELERRQFETRAMLEGFLRRQLWIDPAGAKEARLQTALDELTEEGPGGLTIRGRGPMRVGIVTWRSTG